MSISIVYDLNQVFPPSSVFNMTIQSASDNQAITPFLASITLSHLLCKDFWEEINKLKNKGYIITYKQTKSTFFQRDKRN
jgi:hypothetical protein